MSETSESRNKFVSDLKKNHKPVLSEKERQTIINSLKIPYPDYGFGNGRQIDVDGKSEPYNFVGNISIFDIKGIKAELGEREIAHRLGKAYDEGGKVLEDLVSLFVRSDQLQKYFQLINKNVDRHMAKSKKDPDRIYDSYIKEGERAAATYKCIRQQKEGEDR